MSNPINLPPIGPHDHPEPWAFKWDETEIRAIQAYARQAIEADRAQRGVPVGWVLVPVEPDETMDSVGDMNLMCGAKDVYRAMLSAAPQAQPTEQSAPPAPTPYEAARELGKWLNEQPGHPIDLGLVAALVYHVQSTAQAAPEPWNQLLVEARRAAYDEEGYIMDPDLAEAVDNVDAKRASLPPGEPQQERKPLSEAELKHLFDTRIGDQTTRRPWEFYDFQVFARVIERHHGISASNGKGEQK